MTKDSMLWLAAFSLATLAFAGCTNDEDLGGRSATSDSGVSSGDGSNPANDPDASTSSQNGDDAGSCNDTTDCAIERCDCTSGFTKETLEVQPKCVGSQCIARTRACTDACSNQGLHWVP